MNGSSRVNIIVAVGEGDRVIGNKGSLPWHIPEDTKWFKDHTSGHPIIMGKNTFFVLGKPLPNRTNIVLSDTPWDAAPVGISVAYSLNEAIDIARSATGNEEIYIIGGGMVYREALSIADRLYVTVIHGEFSGDVFFPEYESVFPKIVSRNDREADGYRYSFFVLEKE